MVQHSHFLASKGVTRVSQDDLLAVDLSQICIPTITMVPSLTMRVTAELHCRLRNISTPLSSRTSGAGSRAKPGGATRAYLINKIYGENPLVCGHCGGEMKVLALITEPKTIDTILAFLRRHHPERLPGASQDPTLTYQSRAGPAVL